MACDSCRQLDEATSQFLCKSPMELNLDYKIDWVMTTYDISHATVDNLAICRHGIYVHVQLLRSWSHDEFYMLLEPIHYSLGHGSKDASVCASFKRESIPYILSSSLRCM